MAKKNPPLSELDRRTFLKATGAAAAVTAVAGLPAAAAGQPGRYTGQVPDTPDTSSAVNQVRSVCLQCRSDCGLTAHVRNGVLMKVDGNPYHPNCREPDEILPYGTDPAAAAAERGRMCPKGQAAPEVLYDPLRITRPLKRVGPRGSGRWRSISWEQAIEEICEGGDLFGEGHVDGLRALRSLDPIDPAIPELGPKANQVVVMVGRMEEGQTDFNDRFWGKCFGTVNFRLPHDTICELDWFVGAGESGAANRKPDFLNCKYLLNFGANYMEANFPMQTSARKIVAGLKARGGKLVVVDPRMSKVAAKADRWVPVKPGGDIGILMGMIRWILENHRYNGQFLRTCSAQAATAVFGTDRKGKAIQTHSSAAWLVITDPAHPHYRKFLRADEAGLAGGTSSEFVVVTGGSPQRNTQVATVASVDGVDLFYQGTVNGIAVKSALLLLLERAQEKTYAEYADVAGVDVETIVTLAQEFTSYGTAAVADAYRSVVKKSRGTYQAFAVGILNVLVGNIDRIGGWSAGGGKYNTTTKVVDVTQVPGGVTPSGVGITREKDYTPANVPNLIARDGYPPRRPWYRNKVWQEILPSIQDRYPYPVKCLITYWANPVYTMPAGIVQAGVLQDRSALPLYVAIDINLNETTKFADYILPDGSYLERWGTPGAAPTVVTKVSAWRQPVVGTYDKGTPAERDASAPFDVNAVNEYTPYHPQTKTLEDIYIAIGKRLGLPGVGANAFVDGGSLDRAWDFYKRVLRNLTADANAAGLSVTEEDVVARGGVFQPPEDAYDWSTGFLLNRQNGRNNVYSESWATYLNARTVTAWDPATGKALDGEHFDPLPLVEVRSFDSLGQPLAPDSLPLLLTTYKPVFHTQSRTIVCPSLQMHLPESLIEMNTADAAARGLQDGDLARVFSSSNPQGVIGRVRLTETLRPGVVAIANSLGHWAMQSSPYEVDGQPGDYDPGRALGVHGNPLMKVDPVLGDMPLTDPLGMGAVYFETRVDVVKL